MGGAGGEDGGEDVGGGGGEDENEDDGYNGNCEKMRPSKSNCPSRISHPSMVIHLLILMSKISL